ASKVVGRIARQLQGLKPKMHPRVCGFQRPQLVDCKRIGEDSDALNGRHHFLEQLEPFGRHLDVAEEYSCDIPSRSSETSNVSQCNWVVVNPHHDDGDCACCFLHGT